MSSPSVSDPPEASRGRLLTVPEVADRASVSEYTVHRWIRDGLLAHVRLGSRILRVTEADLQVFLDKRTRQATQPLRRPGRPRKAQP